MTLELRLDELTRLAARALAAAPYEGQASARVRDVPDKRTIRYYTTLGLLDRPTEIRGRTAYYGRRHVLQLVAIKRLQAKGMALVDIQRSLSGADNRTLSRWAELPAAFWEQAASRAQRESKPPAPDELLRGEAPRERDAFWAAPAEPPAAGNRQTPAQAPEIRPAVVIPFSPGVSLLLEGVHAASLSPDLLARLRQAAGPLLDVLDEFASSSS